MMALGVALTPVNPDPEPGGIEVTVTLQHYTRGAVTGLTNFERGIIVTLSRAVDAAISIRGTVSWDLVIGETYMAPTRFIISVPAGQTSLTQAVMTSTRGISAITVTGAPLADGYTFTVNTPRQDVALALEDEGSVIG